MRVCIVIPMYNEESGAEDCVHAVCKTLESIPCPNALFVVNDGSTDNTGNILEQLTSEYTKLTLLNHKKNRGYGSALQTGIAKAVASGFNYVLFLDSDLTNDPKYLPFFIAKMEEGYDVIKASRYIKGGATKGVPALKAFISVVANRIASILYGLPIRDCTNGFRAVKTDILHQMQLHENGFAVIMEELYQAKFLAKSFCEIPYTLTARTESTRSSSFTYHPKVFYGYLKYALKSFLNQAPKHI